MAYECEDPACENQRTISGERLVELDGDLRKICKDCWTERYGPEDAPLRTDVTG